MPISEDEGSGSLGWLDRLDQRAGGLAGPPAWWVWVLLGVWALVFVGGGIVAAVVTGESRHLPLTLAMGVPAVVKMVRTKRGAKPS